MDFYNAFTSLIANYYNGAELMKESLLWDGEIYVFFLMCCFHSRLYLEHQNKEKKKTLKSD